MRANEERHFELDEAWMANQHEKVWDCPRFHPWRAILETSYTVKRFPALKYYMSQEMTRSRRWRAGASTYILFVDICWYTYFAQKILLPTDYSLKNKFSVENCSMGWSQPTQSCILQFFHYWHKMNYFRIDRESKSRWLSSPLPSSPRPSCSEGSTGTSPTPSWQ